MNYQLLLDEKLHKLGGETPHLLLHCCCAVCSSYVLEYLSRYFCITVLFCNPNIFPLQEYEKRKSELMRLISIGDYPNPVDAIDLDYDHGSFLAAAEGLESAPEGGARCAKCFELRLGITARVAKEHGIGLFCTTLTISPHKNAAVINSIGERLAAEHGLEWLPCDFKKREGFKRANQLSEQYGIYRQNYCGCEFAMGHLENNN